jgi:hypothetical protein
VFVTLGSDVAVSRNLIMKEWSYDLWILLPTTDPDVTFMNGSGVIGVDKSNIGTQTVLNYKVNLHENKMCVALPALWLQIQPISI